MNITTLAPNYLEPSRLADSLGSNGFGVLSPTGLVSLIVMPLDAMGFLQADWDDLPLDNFLKDGGRYRRRRHSCFSLFVWVIERPRREDVFASFQREITNT